MKNYNNNNKLENEEFLSVKYRVWKERESTQDHDFIFQAAETLKQPPMVIKILNQIGLHDVESMREFLNADLQSAQNQILNIPDMDRCLKRLLQAVLNQESVYIVSDYDVDGISSAVILMRYLWAWGCKVSCRIPNRFIESHGVNKQIVCSVNDQGCDLTIVLDNGSNAECLDSMNMDVIIVDHHVIETPPTKPILINGQREQSHDKALYRSADLCATGLLFLILLTLQQDEEIRRHKNADRAQQELKKCAIFAAMATVCDSVPLTSINRAIFRSALYDESYNKQIPTGLKALLHKLNIDQDVLSSQSFSFNIGPVINSVSRMTGEIDLALRLFLYDEDNEGYPSDAYKAYFGDVSISDIVKQLIEHNTERKRIESRIMKCIKRYVHDEYNTERYGVKNIPPCLTLHDESWADADIEGDKLMGLVGVIAGRVAQEYHRPTLVFTKDHYKTIWRGSGRSVPEVDLIDCINKVKKHCPSLTAGGHKAALGIGIADDELSTLKEQINLIIQDHYELDTGAIITYFQSQLSVDLLNMEFLKSLNILEPFGQFNPAPLFLVKNLRVIQNLRHGGTTKIQFSDQNGKKFTGMIFNARQEDMDRYFSTAKTCDILVCLNINRYNGYTNLQIVIEDAMSNMNHID